MESMHENQCKKLLISIENCEIMGDIVLGMELVIWNYSESADLTLSHDKVQECIGLLKRIFKEEAWLACLV